MSSTQVRSESVTEIPRAGMVDMKLEVIVIPVSDVDRAKRFYSSLGWRLDAEFATGEDFRVVQMTPPGSECSIIFGKGITSAVPAQFRACIWSSSTSKPPEPSSSTAPSTLASCSTTSAGCSTTPGSKDA